MKRLLAVALVTLVAAGAVNAQGVLDAEIAGGDYTATSTRDAYAYLENTASNSFLPAGNYGYFGIADDIRFTGRNPINMTSFEVNYFSRITSVVLPLKMEVNFYSYWTNPTNGYIYMGDHNWGHFEVEGLGTGNHVVTVDVNGRTWLPGSVWMEVGFYDANGTYAVDTGVILAADKQAEVGNTSNDYYLIMAPPGNVGGLYWLGGYTPTLPMTDPNWNPAANYILGISVPEPLTLGLVALGGLLAIRRRR